MLLTNYLWGFHHPTKITVVVQAMTTEKWHKNPMEIGWFHIERNTWAGTNLDDDSIHDAIT